MASKRKWIFIVAVGAVFVAVNFAIFLFSRQHEPDPASPAPEPNPAPISNVDAKPKNTKGFADLASKASIPPPPKTVLITKSQELKDLRQALSKTIQSLAKKPGAKPIKDDFSTEKNHNGSLFGIYSLYLTCRAVVARDISICQSAREWFADGAHDEFCLAIMTNGIPFHSFYGQHLDRAAFTTAIANFPPKIREDMLKIYQLLESKAYDRLSSLGLSEPTQIAFRALTGDKLDFPDAPGVRMLAQAIMSGSDEELKNSNYFEPYHILLALQGQSGHCETMLEKHIQNIDKTLEKEN